MRAMLVRGVELCVDTFGDPADPAILLIMAAGSMDWWEPEFCAQLAAGSRYVIRYDHRDTGGSVSYPPGAPGYTGEDLVADAAGVLDALGVAAAHVVGLSAGGGIAQLLALTQPSRVSSLTLISTTAGAGDDDLPGMSPELAASFSEPQPEPDWTDRAAVIEHLVAGQRVMACEPFDDAAVREVAIRVVDRTTNMESSEKNHFAAPGEADSWRPRLPSITVPTLVLHGAADPLFPLAHGAALANEIPNARLVVLPATGHEFPRRNWPLVIPELLKL